MKATKKQTEAEHDPLSGLLHATRTATLEVTEAVNIARYLAERAGRATRTDIQNVAAMLDSVARKMGEINERVMRVQKGNENE